MIDLPTIGLMVVIIGLLFDGIGAILIAVPNGPPNRIRDFLYSRSTSVENLQEARDRLIDRRTLRRGNDDDLMDAIQPVLTRELGFEDREEPIEIGTIAQGFQMQFPSGLTNNRAGITNRDRKLERWINRAIERYFVYLGVLSLLVGFTFQALGVIIQLLG